MSVTMAEVRFRKDAQFIAHLADFNEDDDFVLHVSARVFGLLAETAGPILEHYHSDLFWDAKFLRDAIGAWDLTKTLTWNWSVNSTGTRVSQGVDGNAREFAFKCSLWAEKRSYGTRIMFRMERV